MFLLPFFVDGCGGPREFITRITHLVLGFPALVPEVWLNYLGPDKTLEDEKHLRENPSRVDFVGCAWRRSFSARRLGSRNAERLLLGYWTPTAFRAQIRTIVRRFVLAL